jgi:hypothetical protein
MRKLIVSNAVSLDVYYTGPEANVMVLELALPLPTDPTAPSPLSSPVNLPIICSSPLSWIARFCPLQRRRGHTAQSTLY